MENLQIPRRTVVNIIKQAVESEPFLYEPLKIGDLFSLKQKGYSGVVYRVIEILEPIHEENGRLGVDPHYKVERTHIARDVECPEGSDDVACFNWNVLHDFYEQQGLLLRHAPTDSVLAVA